jgi:hypothetical protein
MVFGLILGHLRFMNNRFIPIMGKVTLFVFGMEFCLERIHDFFHTFYTSPLLFPLPNYVIGMSMASLSSSPSLEVNISYRFIFNSS